MSGPPWKAASSLKASGESGAVARGPSRAERHREAVVLPAPVRDPAACGGTRGARSIAFDDRLKAMTRASLCKQHDLTHDARPVTIHAATAPRLDAGGDPRDPAAPARA